MNATESSSDRIRPSGLVLGRVFGIEIRLDVSVLVIFVLVAVSLASSLFPTWHPDWSPLLTWSSALAAALVFFVSLLLHELSHSLMAKRQGIEVPRITLFLFGGMAEMSAEPKTPQAEFLVAIVGPLASFALALAFGVLGSMLTPEGFMDLVVEDREQAFSSLGPLATICIWLAPVNLVLAIFNLVPGFPLDGGRVLRAFLWWWTGDLLKATRLASLSGRVFAGALMAFGIVNLIWGRALEGIWFLIIGWFLSHIAAASYQQMLLRVALRGLVVGDLMRTHFESVDANTPLESFIDGQLLRSAQSLWPVVTQGRLLGFVSQADIARHAESERAHLVVRDVMRPLSGMSVLSPALAGPDAFEHLAAMADEPLPVIDGSTLVGLLHASDIFRFLALHRMRLTP